MELLFSLDLICKKLDFLDRSQESLTCLHSLWSASNSPLDVLWVQLSDTNSDPVTLFCDLYRFSEHLHGFHFFLNLQIRNFQSFANFHLAREDCASHDRTLPFNLKTVVDGKFEMLFLGVSVWDFHIHQNCVEKLFNSVRCRITGGCCYGNNWQKSPKLGVFEPCS